MVPITLVQYADQQNLLHFVQYEDGSHGLHYPSDDSEEAAQLRAWLQQGNTAEPYSPLISGGVVPVAAIMWICSQRPPEGYLLCDGSPISRARYSQLFRAIGTIYGEGNGVTTFNLPDLVGRFCRGWGPASALDPDRQFGSYQEDEVGLHSHGLQPAEHNHSITDPGHMHGVTDPGHTHTVQDPGHNHSVTDPGHKHYINEVTHTGWADFFSRSNSGLLRMDFGPLNPYYKEINFVLSTNIVNMAISTDKANFIVASAQSNVTTGSAVTNISIDRAETNIPFTAEIGTEETRPDNIALLPVIRY